MLGRLLLAAVAALLLSAPAASAAPPGRWTLVTRDAFRHYACKVPTAVKGRFALRTHSDLAGNRRALRNRIGTWVVVVRRSKQRQLFSRNANAWRAGAIRFAIRKRLLASDRIWMQGAYYGPTEPWADGTRIGRLATCARGT